LAREEPTVNAAAAAQILSTTASDQKENEQMSEQQEAQFRSISREELDEIAGEALPERAAMSLVNANVAIPINAAVAANVLSDNAVAYANAAQQTPIDQSQ
jgi:hypothetical protein